MTRTRKILLGIPATALAIYLIWLFSCYKHEKILAAGIKEDIGFDLMLQFRSKYVPTVGTATVARLQDIHLKAPHVRVRPGDAPAPIGDGTADYQIIYVFTDRPNHTNIPLLGLRMKLDGTNHHIRGFWTPAN